MGDRNMAQSFAFCPAIFLSLIFLSFASLLSAHIFLFPSLLSFGYQRWIFKERAGLGVGSRGVGGRGGMAMRIAGLVFVLSSWGGLSRFSAKERDCPPFDPWDRRAAGYSDSCTLYAAAVNACLLCHARWMGSLSDLRVAMRGNALGRGPRCPRALPLGWANGCPFWVDRTYGLLRWSGDPGLLRRIAEDDEFSILESP
jgi:hypothetical protein